VIPPDRIGLVPADHLAAPGTDAELGPFLR
jgi:hypothetical protein